MYIYLFLAKMICVYNGVSPCKNGSWVSVHPRKSHTLHGSFCIFYFLLEDQVKNRNTEMRGWSACWSFILESSRSMFMTWLILGLILLQMSLIFSSNKSEHDYQHFEGVGVGREFTKDSVLDRSTKERSFYTQITEPVPFLSDSWMWYFLIENQIMYH